MKFLYHKVNMKKFKNKVKEDKNKLMIWKINMINLQKKVKNTLFNTIHILKNKKDQFKNYNHNVKDLNNKLNI